ncbi:hypothetical protein [Thermogemmatispora sp.]|jgi:hypothetical protein|uniref:hypothetical protein n=1 Tax=Thermogemmatispora sp. TaxID=1968838 RepID=UPI0035E42226
MAEESPLVALQRRQIEITFSQYVLARDPQMRQKQYERLRELIAHAGPDFDYSQLDWATMDALRRLGLIPKE